jgi:hypothetical protein
MRISADGVNGEDVVMGEFRLNPIYIYKLNFIYIYIYIYKLKLRKKKKRERERERNKYIRKRDDK